MKGKNEFTQNEINEIVALIRKRCSAPQSEQTKIRNKMRRIGFYGRAGRQAPAPRAFYPPPARRRRESAAGSRPAPVHRWAAGPGN